MTERCPRCGLLAPRDGDGPWCPVHGSLTLLPTRKAKGGEKNE